MAPSAHYIVPNEVEARVHLSRNVYGWGTWMWGLDDVRMERWGQLKK